MMTCRELTELLIDFVSKTLLKRLLNQLGSDNLALRGFYVLHTDHLSDRELYAELWERGLRDPAHLPGRGRQVPVFRGPVGGAVRHGGGPG